MSAKYGTLTADGLTRVGCAACGAWTLGWVLCCRGTDVCGGGEQAAYIHRFLPNRQWCNQIICDLQSNANGAGELTCVVVDELHMVCDPHRGLPLELSITKLLFSRYADRIQLIGMSATMGGEQVSCYAWEACPHSALLGPALASAVLLMPVLPFPCLCSCFQKRK